MTELDKSWLAGVFDSRGSVNVTKSRNVIGVVVLKFSSKMLSDTAVAIIESHGIHCNPSQQVGKTHVLTFASSRGTQLLELLLPYLKSQDHKFRAELYCELFPEESRGVHMKINRLDGYLSWLKLMQAEKNDTDRSVVLRKIQGE